MSRENEKLKDSAIKNLMIRTAMQVIKKIPSWADMESCMFSVIIFMKTKKQKMIIISPHISSYVIYTLIKCFPKCYKSKKNNIHKKIMGTIKKSLKISM